MGILYVRQPDGSWGDTRTHPLRMRNTTEDGWITQGLIPNKPVRAKRTDGGWEQVATFGTIYQPDLQSAWNDKYTIPVQFLITSRLGYDYARNVMAEVNAVDKMRFDTGFSIGWSASTQTSFAWWLPASESSHLHQDTTGYIVVDLALMRRMLPEDLLLSAEIQFQLFLNGRAYTSSTLNDTNYLHFPFDRYSARVWDVTGQPALTTATLPDNDMRFYNYNYFDQLRPTYDTVSLQGQDITVIDDAGFAFSGTQLGAFDYGSNTDWRNAGAGSGLLRTSGARVLTVKRTVSSDEFYSADHLEFALTIDPIEAPVRQETYDLDFGPVPNSSNLNASGNLTVNVYSNGPREDGLF